MKILQIAPLVESVPPKKYGGTERVIYTLTEELVKRGHDVTLFASGDSKTNAKLISVTQRALRGTEKEPYGPNPFTMLNIGKAYSLQEKFDIIHDHYTDISLPTANISKTPVVLTLHGPITAKNKKLYESLNNPYYVTISEAQSLPLPNLHKIGMVYNGLNMEHYPFSKENDGYLLYVGRISIQKGVHFAIEAALYLGLPLIMAAKVEPPDVPYFREYVEPYLSDQIKWIGEVTEEERNKLMSKALCFLHPVTWREPFGLTLIESMACGCPVVAMGRGSIPEIVKNGKTGFVVFDVEEMIEGVLNIDSIDRVECRRYALQNFNGKKMADSYEEIYKKILGIQKENKTNKKNTNALKKNNGMYKSSKLSSSL